MYGLTGPSGIIRELVAGVALGLGPRQIARRMAQDGMTDALNHLLLVTRDQYNRSHRTGHPPAVWSERRRSWLRAALRPAGGPHVHRLYRSGRRILSVRRTI